MTNQTNDVADVVLIDGRPWWRFTGGHLLPVIAGGSDDGADADTDDDTFDPARAKAKIAKVNAEAAQLRKRAKEAEERVAALEAQIGELTDRDKSEVEKLAKRAAEAERKAQEAELRAMRAEVAASKGLTPAQAKRLIGSTLEELEADADELLASFSPREGTGDEKSPPPGRPTPHLKGGTDPTEQPDIDVGELINSIPPTA